MRLPPLILILCLGQIVMKNDLAFCSPVPSVEELEKKAIGYRLKYIKQGHVKMRVINDTPSPRRTESLYEVTFDEQRIRQIVRKRVAITSACKILTYSCWQHTELMDAGNNS